ncbi:hypothetical protein NA57DRAFT_33761, partial [Rhizodiscina lignyota]
LPGSMKTTRHTEIMYTIDWSKTSLGHMENWDQQLRTMVNVVMDNPMPAILYCGPEYIMIYNEAFVPLMHKYHPQVFGTSAPVTQHEYWQSFAPIIQYNIRTGKAVMHNHLQLFLRRNGILEETYFAFSFLPIIGKEGKIIAHYETIVETTKEVISQRRMSTLLNTGQQTSVVRDQETFWSRLLDTLHANKKDVPFALVYTVQADSCRNSPGPNFATRRSSRKCLLRGSVGIPANHHAAFSCVDFEQSDEGWAPFFRSAITATHPVAFLQEDHTALTELLRGTECPDFGVSCSSVVISPITPTAHDNILAFVIMGLNPRTPYNEGYQKFIHVASRLIETSLASVVLLEEEVQVRERMARQAAEIQAKLAAELKISHQEIVRKERKFERFAERANVGIFILDMTGQYTYRNPAWFDIFQPAAEDFDGRDAWLKLVDPEDAARCQAIFGQLYEKKENIEFELRLRRPWDAPRELQDPAFTSESRTWVLCSAYPEINENGDVSEVVGCVTDVSRQKFGEGMQKQRAANALESKRRLENFIDTTSHEMRNPLTAIIQCADDIIRSYNNLLGSSEGNAVTVTYDLLETSLDAAQTIIQCAQHQKRIVDDILTMSKLDSDLLTITPVQIQPKELAARAVKMLAPEARSADVSMHFAVEESYWALAVDWVLLDPTRILQVLINLITNAIKFTRLEERREIIVSVGASLLEQPTSSHGVTYVRGAKQDSPSEEKDVSPLERKDYIFVHFTVQDTGRGLSENEKNLIFLRFSQASPRTHINYGGSGLGLFISRRLVEIQGGAIGFASERKAGSTFSFYVKASRVSLEGGSPTSPGKLLRQSSSKESPFALLRHIRTSSAPEVQSVVVSPATSPSPTSMPTPSIETPGPLYILIVEDNLVNQRVLAKQLKGLGCKIAVANHGAEALSYLQTTKFWSATSEDSGQPLSMVLMDWEMPVMDGLTCVKEIRKLETERKFRAHVPVIGVTANARPEQLDQAMAAGMDDVVTKPFRVPDVVTRMKSIIDRLKKTK